MGEPATVTIGRPTENEAERRSRQPRRAAPSGAGAAAVWRPARGGNAFEITVADLTQAIRRGMVAGRSAPTRT